MYLKIRGKKTPLTEHVGKIYRHAKWIMKYRDSTSDLDTPRKILKLNHAGEFGAVNIYRSQLCLSRLFMFEMPLGGYMRLAEFWEAR